MIDEEFEIGYRVRRWLYEYPWPFGGGNRLIGKWIQEWDTTRTDPNIYNTLASAKRSGSQNADYYQVWKMYVGIDPTEYFPPKLIYEQRPPRM